MNAQRSICLQCHPDRETRPGLRHRATGVRVDVSNAHLSCRRPTSGFALLAPGVAQPLGEVGAELDEDPLFFRFPVSQLLSCRSPPVSIKLADIPYPFLLDTDAELSVIPSYILSQLPPDYFGNTPRTHLVHGFAGRDVVIKGPYPLSVEVCGVKFIHPFYTLDSPTHCVAGYDLMCAAKLVIDPVRHMVWSYWHVDLYATPSPRTLPAPRIMSAGAQPTTSVSTTVYIPHGCRRMLCVDDSAVESPSTE